MVLWVTFCLSGVIGLIFAVLCALSYQVRAAGGVHVGREGEEAEPLRGGKAMLSC